MKINIEQIKSFDLPEGYFRVQFRETKQILKRNNSKHQTYCRLLFEVIHGPQKFKWAGRNFLPSLTKRSQLREFLEDWLGGDFFGRISARQFDIETLIGREADILITHITNSPDMPPFCCIAEIHPPGTRVSFPYSPPQKGPNN